MGSNISGKLLDIMGSNIGKLLDIMGSNKSSLQNSSPQKPSLQKSSSENSKPQKEIP